MRPILHNSSTTNFAHFIDPKKPVFGFLSNFVHFIHLYMNPLPQNKHYKKCPLFSSEAATRGVLCEKVFLEISHNSQENKKDTLAQVFFVNFVKFLRTPFLQNTSRRLLLFRSGAPAHHSFTFNS